MEHTDKTIIEDLREENRLLKLKIGAYKEELKSVSDKLDYSQKFLSLYESIIDSSREEIKVLSSTVKKLESSSSPKKKVDKSKVKVQAKKSLKKRSIKKIKK